MKRARRMEVQDDIPGQIPHGNRRSSLCDRHGREGAPFDPLEDESPERRGGDQVKTGWRRYKTHTVGCKAASPIQRYRQDESKKEVAQ